MGGKQGSESERRLKEAHYAHAAETMRSMVVPVSPSPKRARLGSPAPRERHEAWEQDEEGWAKHRRVPPWALEPAVAPVSSHPRKRVAGVAATAATAAPDSQDAPVQTESDLSPADTPLAVEDNPQEPGWLAHREVCGELTLKSTTDHRRAKRAGAGGAGAANRDPIDLTGESPQPLTARRQGMLSRANSRFQCWPGGGEGASGRRPSRRNGQAVLVIEDDEEHDDSLHAAFAVESDDEGARSTSFRGGRSRDLAGASGSRGARAEGKGEPRAPQRHSTVVLMDEGTGDKGKAPADERPSYAPAMAAQGDRMQITSTVSRSFTCPICYDDVEKGG